jgi:YaiO family outer membrane protein
MKLNYKNIAIVILVLLVSPVFSQEKEFTGNPDVAFEKARNMAFNNQRKEAQELLIRIIAKYPNYLDLRSFLANTYSWDGNYKVARTGFDFVLKKDPKRKADWIAAIKNEFYAEVPYSANVLIKKAMVHYPKDPEILFQKARSEEKLNKPEDALYTLNEILKIDPTNKDALAYKVSLNDSFRLSSIGLSYSTLIYNKNERETSHYGTLKYSRQTKYGSITGKINYSKRFGTNNYQYEVDMYPRITEGLYAYVSGGFSNSDLFPSVRYGFELFKSLPKSFEASLGFRGLKFSTTTIIYTGSVGWYTGNSYWSFRTYITPGDPGASKSGTLSYRKYFSDADNYFSLAVGFGFSPEVDRFPVNVNDIVVFDLKSQKFNAGYTFTSANKKNIWGTSFNLLREEKSFSRDDYYLIYSLGVSYNFRFR